MLLSFMFLGISRAGDCTFLYNWKGSDYYYDPSEVTYSGNIVSFVVYRGGCASAAKEYWELEIDCAKKMIRDNSGLADGDWEPIRPGSFDELYLKKLCR